MLLFLFTKITQHCTSLRWLAIVLLLAALMPVAIARALLYNPTSPPPGGQSAPPLNASPNTQTKIGSLTFGISGGTGTCNYTSSNNGCAILCLNTDNTADPSKCVKSWKDLTGELGPNIKLNQGELAADPQPGFQTGYLRIQGNNAANYPATSRFNIPNLSGTFTALYADGLTLDNFAGYFSGQVGVEPVGGTIPSGLGRLCLNGTASPIDASGHGCVSSWSQVTASSITNNLKLQPTNGAMEIEQGSVSVEQAFNSGYLVFGDPINAPVSAKCGDGICSTSGNFPENGPNCPADCPGVINPPAFFSASPGENAITLKVRSSDPLGDVVIARSDKPNFSFIPVDGMTYAVGGDSNLAIVYRAPCAITVPPSACEFSDSNYGFLVGKTYYYRAFQGNTAQRYNTTPRTAFAHSGDSGTPNDPPEPIILPRR